MQTTLLSTKLYIPPTRDTLVARPRLTAILSNALVKSFTLVSAPAGYGKTTLVSSWLRETGIPSAWLSLEESDNDPVSFLQYLLTTLQKVIPTIRIDLLDLVEGIQPASLQALMNILINEIAKIDSQFVLVLDDFHLIQNQLILDTVAFLLDHIPAQQMHLMLITRTDPPLLLSRLRARKQMVEIRAAQLRFTPDEVAALINGEMGFDLSDRQISAMYVRTEGWVAGLQLAGLSMEGCQDVPGFINAFSGSHHYIVDYLADEVLKRQDEQTRTFLLQTSILSRMCASLCDSMVVMGDEKQQLDGQTMLETLERMNLFIIPLDEERRWYRYHHLFADALNRCLEYQYPELLPKLYQRASEWYEKNGLIGEAIQCALSAGDQERVAQLVEQNGCYLLMSGEVLTLLKWLETVEQYFPAHPWLVIQKGWALSIAGRMEQAEKAFQIAEKLVITLETNADVNSMVGTISAGRAYWANIQGNIPEAARLAQQAMDLLPDTDPMSCSMRSVATGTLAKTKWMIGDFHQARQIYDQAVEICQATNNDEMLINTNADIAVILMEQGQLRKAEQLLLETLKTAIRPDGQRLPLSAGIYSELSKVYYEWNQLEQSEHYAHQCLEVSQQWGNVEQQAIGIIMSAKLEQANGNIEKAQVMMRTADQLNRDNHLYIWNSIWIEAALDRFWLSLGSLERVSQRIKASEINPADEITYLLEAKYITLLRWLLACEDYETALGLAERMLQKAQNDHCILQVVELLVLEALAYLGKKETAVAVTTLGRSVALAQPEGYKRVFLDEGELVQKLLHLVKSNQDATGYARELLESSGPISAITPVPIQLLIEPLSGREIEVLKLIEAGLSNQEIGSRLFISITTVKKHISNIYAKLDVKTRTQAVSRAKELGFFAG
jgi:LuxR family transcriptional regulator, maltose regulon positive regulatory protein